MLFPLVSHSIFKDFFLFWKTDDALPLGILGIIGILRGHVTQA